MNETTVLTSHNYETSTDARCKEIVLSPAFVNKCANYIKEDKELKSNPKEFSTVRLPASFIDAVKKVEAIIYVFNKRVPDTKIVFIKKDTKYQLCELSIYGTHKEYSPLTSDVLYDDLLSKFVNWEYTHITSKKHQVKIHKGIPKRIISALIYSHPRDFPLIPIYEGGTFKECKW